MIENIVTIFDDMSDMLKRLKKKRYEQNMDVFVQRHGHFFQEMIQLVDESEDKEKTAKEIATEFADAVQKKFTKWGRIFGYVQVNLNFFMIYYVFPAILLERSGQKISAVSVKESDSEEAEGKEKAEGTAGTQKVQNRSLGTILCDAICAEWAGRFKDSKIQYTDYQTLHDSFNEKIFGIF